MATKYKHIKANKAIGIVKAGSSYPTLSITTLGPDCRGDLLWWSPSPLHSPHFHSTGFIFGFLASSFVRFLYYIKRLNVTIDQVVFWWICLIFNHDFEAWLKHPNVVASFFWYFEVKEKKWGSIRAQNYNCQWSSSALQRDECSVK